MIVEHKVCETCSRLFLREVGSGVRDCNKHSQRQIVRSAIQPSAVENKPVLTKLPRRQLAWAMAFEGRR